MENSLEYINSATILNFPESLKETKIAQVDIEQSDMSVDHTKRFNTKYTEPGKDGTTIVLWVQHTVSYNAADFIVKIEKTYLGPSDPGMA